MTQCAIAYGKPRWLVISHHSPVTEYRTGIVAQFAILQNMNLNLLKCLPALALASVAFAQTKSIDDTHCKLACWASVTYSDASQADGARRVAESAKPLK